MSDNPFRKLPAVNHILDREEIKALESECAHALVLDAVRAALDDLRARLQAGQPFDDSMAASAVAERVAQSVRLRVRPRIRAAINATGIVLHTNLGRSPLAEAAARAAYEAAAGYLNLELDLATGKRSSRQNPIREVLATLTGAESATAVNNCAAATVIVLRALAAGREVIVSRGQLIEIGGGFRIPEIMAVSGAALREVGTTNITRIEDYENAIGPATGLLMRIHTSNYRIRGFTQEVGLEELAALGKKHQLPVVDDAGSGAMLDFARFGLPGDPIVPRSIAAGADLVIFSGDKLLGGPQAGLIVGKEEWIRKIERDPLMRAFRLDKMTLAALETTLRLYLNPAEAVKALPTLRMMSMSESDLRPRCEALAEKIGLLDGAGAVEVRSDSAYVGGGSLPDLPLPTVVIAVKPAHHSEESLADRLRMGAPAVVARIQDGQVVFDLRTVLPGQEELLLEALGMALKAGGPNDQAPLASRRCE